MGAYELGVWRAVRVLLVVVGVVAAGACASGETVSTGDGQRPVSSAEHAADGSAGTLEEAAVRAAYVLSRQRAAGPEFAMRVAELPSDGLRGDGALLVADNAPHRFVASFGQDRLVLRDRVAEGESPAWQATVRVDAFGCKDALAPLGADLGAAAPAALDDGRANGIQQDHGALQAWYLNGPLGLEQGFEVPERPSCLDGEAELTLAMTVDGLTPRLGVRHTPLGDNAPLGDDTDEVELVDEAGTVRLRYHGLYVSDASGAGQPATLRVDAGRVLIDVQASGASFPLSIDPLWSQQQELTASDAAADDEFGFSVSLSGDTAVVGAYLDDDGGTDSGAAYVFVRSGATWTEQQKLTATDAAAGDQFGWAVSVEGDTAVVGASGDDAAAGSAYVFVRSGATWTEQQKLTAMDAAAGDGFGRSVSQSAESAIISAPLDADAGANTGSAYVFVRSGTTWTEQQKLTAMDAAANDYFGLSVSLSGDTALVGAQGDDDGGSNTGSAYVFVRSGTTWTPEQKLNASDPGAEDQFGYSVSVDGDTALVGAPTHDDGGMDTGSAYVFVRSGTTWTEEQKLGPSNPATIDNFGYSVSLSGDTALVGAIRYMGIGSAYVLVRSGTTWTEDQEVAASDGEQANLFGYSVSLSGDTALVGAQGHDHGAGAKSGAAFAFTLLGIPCTQDSDCDSGFCRDGVCCDSDCSGTCEVCSAANGASDDGLCTELAMPCGGGGAGGSAPGTGGAPTTSSSSSGFGGAPEREVPPQDDCDCSFPGAPLGGSASRLGALAALALLTLQRRRRRGRSRRGGHPPS